MPPHGFPGVPSVLLLFLLVCGLTCPTRSEALEKYGRPLPPIGDVGTPGVAHDKEEAEEPLVRGFLLAAGLPYNPTFAARPNNTGLVGMRYMLHLETDLYQDYLQFYTDQNFFSDRDTGWIELSEWDATVALTGTVRQWGWRVQYERDAPIDQSGLIQAYADTVVTHALPSANRSAWWRQQFPNQNLNAYLGAGWLFYNESYFARPDNTGRALFRYVAHADLDLYRNWAVLFADVNMFTDRDASNVVTPSEVDLVTGLALHRGHAEFSVYYERDMPVGQATLVQQYVAIQVRYEFSWGRREAHRP